LSEFIQVQIFFRGAIPVP